MRALGPVIAVLVVLVLLLSGTLYTVDQRQNAIVFQLAPPAEDTIPAESLHAGRPPRRSWKCATSESTCAVAGPAIAPTASTTWSTRFAFIRWTLPPPRW